MRVLVTGHRGYIGSVVTSVLRHASFDVVGLDCDLYGSCDFGRVQESIPSFDIDLRDVEFTELLSFDAVVHLAALPRGSSLLDPALMREINEDATIRLAACCKKANVPAFLYASSCEVYGCTRSGLLDEKSPAAPATADAMSTFRCERVIESLADHTFAPVILRTGDVYGASPRLRMDLPVNDFVASAVVNGRIEVGGNGQAWKSLIHVEDVARAYLAVLTAPVDAVARQVFNLAAPGEIYRVVDLADEISELVSGCTRSMRQFAFTETGRRIDGSKFQRAFPKFSYRWTLPLGIRQLCNAIAGAGTTPGDWRSDRYRRALRLETLMERGEFTAALRRKKPTAA